MQAGVEGAGMTEAQIQEIVRRVVAALGDEATTPGGERRSALVLFTGALLGFDDALPALTRLRADVDLHYICTPSAEHILDRERIEAVGMKPADRARVAAHDLAIVPTLTVNVAAKLVRGIGDCLASNVLGEFLMSAKPVVAARNGVCPESPDKRSWYPDMPAAYADMLRDNLTRLAAFGAKLPLAADLDGEVRALIGHPAAQEPGLVGLVTVETVYAVPAGGTIHLAPRAIVTALAREAAEERDVALTHPAIERRS